MQRTILIFYLPNFRNILKFQLRVFDQFKLQREFCTIFPILTCKDNWDSLIRQKRSFASTCKYEIKFNVINERNTQQIEI